MRGLEDIDKSQKMESDRHMASSVTTIPSESAGSVEGLGCVILPPLVKKTRWKGRGGVPVAVLRVLAFIVTFVSLYIRICRDHRTVASGNFAVGGASQLKKRRLSVSGRQDFHDDSTSGLADRLSHIRSFPTISLEGRRGGGAANLGVAATPSISIGGDVSVRRLSDRSSTSSDESSSSLSESASQFNKGLVYELCQEAGDAEGNIFAQLLDFERTGDAGGRLHSIGGALDTETVLGGSGHLSAQMGDDGFTKAAGSSVGLALPDASLANLMDPAISPSTLVEEQALVSEASMFDIEKPPGALGQLHDVAHVSGIAEESPFLDTSSIMGEWSYPNVAESQYSQLLTLWHLRTGGGLSSEFSASSEHPAVKRALPVGAMLTAADSEAERQLSSEGCRSDTADLSRIAPSVAGKTKESITKKRLKHVELGQVQSTPNPLAQSKALLEREMRLLHSRVAPWDLRSEFFGSHAKLHFSKAAVIALRSLLSNAPLTCCESIHAISVGKQILQEIHPLTRILGEEWNCNYRALAGVLVHMAIRLDTLLWLTDMFPKITCPEKWWMSLVEYSNIDTVLKFDMGFESRYKRVIVRCFDSLRSLVDRKRLEVSDVAWMMPIFKVEVSKVLKAAVDDSTEQGFPSEAPPSKAKARLATHSRLQAQRAASLAKTFMDKERDAPAGGNGGPSHGERGSHGTGQSSPPPEATAKQGVEASQKCESVKSEASSAVTKAMRQERKSHKSEGPFEKHETLISALTNVPELPDPVAVKTVLLPRCLWDITNENIGEGFHPRYAIEYPARAFSILSHQELSVGECIRLLSLGLKILQVLRPIQYTDPQDRSWKARSRAKVVGLYVIQLDTLLRITTLFPEVTRPNLWWSQIVEKSNLRTALQTTVSPTCRFYQMIESSKEALRALLQRTRPEITQLDYIIRFYSEALKDPLRK